MLVMFSVLYLIEPQYEKYVIQMCVQQRLGSVYACAQSRGCKFESQNQIISMVIIYLPLIQEGQLSVTGKSMCTKYWLTA